MSVIGYLSVSVAFVVIVLIFRRERTPPTPPSESAWEAHRIHDRWMRERGYL
jgi:hypothetical protein